MVAGLLLRGMIAGLIAGLLAFAFANVVGEPPLDRAIAFEAAHEAHHGAGQEAEPELVSRTVQSTVGLLTGVVIYGAALGGILALVFAYALGRLGSLGPRALAGVLALAGFVAVTAIPALKYPPNPPAIGSPDTIGYRTEMFLLMLLISLAATVFAINLARRLASRYGNWNAAAVAAIAFVAIIAAAHILLPDINEVPEHFPADVLWQFRVAALGVQFVTWIALGFVFGWFAERNLENRGHRQKAA